MPSVLLDGFGLTTSDPSVATVAGSLIVPEGGLTASFTVATSSTLTPMAAGVTASYNGVSQTAVLNVTPPSSLSLYAISIDPMNVAGGSGATGTVTLSGAAPNGGAEVTLSSSDPARVSVPSRVRVKGGETSASFSITTAAVTSVSEVTLTGSYGELTQSERLTVIPPTGIGLVSVTLWPATVRGGTQTSGTVTLDAPAPSGGLAVSLASKQKKLVVLAGTVMVPGGMTSGTFPIETRTVRRNDTAEIRASSPRGEGSREHRGACLVAEPFEARLSSARPLPARCRGNGSHCTARPLRLEWRDPEVWSDRRREGHASAFALS